VQSWILIDWAQNAKSESVSGPPALTYMHANPVKRGFGESSEGLGVE
jgi:hypothetical protein